MKYSFSPVSWSIHTNVYEVNVRQYTEEGTFNAFANHLPRLREMGVEVLWFMPITPISVKGRLGTLGSYYACSSYTAINPEFGTLEDFKTLVKKAHEFGFKVIIDWVANHTGMDHEWTTSHPEFYRKDAEGNFYDHHGWQDVYDLNYYDYGLRRFMTEAMLYWVKECDIDGFRCDMAHLVPRDFWQQARETIDSIKPLYWLAETDDGNYLTVFDCHYTWRWMHETECFFKGESSMVKLLDILHFYWKDFPPQAQHLYFTSNHDENSWNGSEYEKYGEGALALAVFSCTWDSIPLIYSGQELPNRKRLHFFEKDCIEWNQPPALHGFYRTLLELRKTHPAIIAGKEALPKLIPVNENNEVMVFSRTWQQRSILVLLNFSANNYKVQIPASNVSGNFTNLFDNQLIDFNTQSEVELHSWGYKVFVS